MPDVALISDITWRGLEMQREAFPNMPHFVGPDEIPTMLRPSNRKDVLRIHVLSLAIIAENADKLRMFVRAAYERDAKIISKETGKEYCRRTKIAGRVVDDWLTARRIGAAKAGGEENAKRAEREFWEGFSKIKDRWHLPAKKENASKPLLKQARTSRNTVRRYI
jgi:hypothetical protein